MVNITLLEKEINGTGEVSDLKYVQNRVSTTAYLYEVWSNGRITCFEVFERKNTPVCIDFEKRIYSETEFKESYPKSNAFGVWAWSYLNFSSALLKFNSI